MKLYIEKDKCTIRESLNGRVLEIETEDPVYLDDDSTCMFLNPWHYTDIPTGYEPFLSKAPKDYHF